MADLFPRLDSEPPPPRELDALAALALACAHAHALSYPHRERPPTETWLQRYAQTQGASDSVRFHAALHRLSRADREAIAADLLREP